MKQTIRNLFLLIRARGAIRIPDLEKINLKICSLADQEHEQSNRQFMHYNHHKHVVCYAEAAEELSLEWKIGLVAHELGHAAADLLGLFRKHSETDANRLGSAILESEIRFRGPKRLEWASVPPWLTEVLQWNGVILSRKRS